jgi:trimethylamine--corrinoid protein Co-methyltransferase
MNASDAPHEKLGLNSNLYQPLDPAGVKKTAEATMEVLAKSGVAVYSKRAREAMIQAGAEAVDDSPNLRLPRAMVEDAIDSNPSSITLHSRDGQNDCILEGSKVHYGTGGTAIYVLDPETGERRPSQTRDVILNARMVQALRNIHLFTINVFPNDIKAKDEIDVNRFYHSLNHTTKHIMGGIYSMEGCKKVIAMAEEIAGSPEALREKPFVSFITLIISPYKIDDIYGDMTCLLAENNLPVVVPTEPICGTTSPITLAGNVLTHISETIAGIVLVQSVRKGAPGICGGVGSIPDLHTMGHLGGPIERGMINAAVAQMAQHFKIPVYSTAGTTDAKSVDVQASYESAMSSLLVAMSGANYIHDIAGLMESDLTVSYEKLVMDNEILGMCQRVLSGIEVTDETLAADLIIERGPTSDFLAEEHTVRHMRGEFFFPSLANRDKRENLESPDALSAARRFVADLRSEEAAPRIDEKTRKGLLSAFPELRMT